MERIRICQVCEVSFDLFSSEKIRAGGKINECHNCCSEETVKYLGIQAADGKQSQASILKFSSKKDREAYSSFWRNNSGINVSKSCQLGNHLSSTPAIKFQTIVAHNPTNHKGKSE